MMALLAAYASILATSIVLDAGGRPVPRLVAMLPLIALDCLGNMALGQSWRNTMSGEAWHHRDHPWWGWCHRFIDALFFWQPHHCQIHAQREAVYGSVWAAWWAEFTAAQG